MIRKIEILCLAIITASCAEKPPLVETPVKEPEARKTQSVSNSPGRVAKGRSSGIGLDAFYPLQQSGDVLIYDVRVPYFYNIDHIPGALNWPHDQFDAQLRMRDLEIRDARNSGKPVVVYCTSLLCAEARNVAKKIARRGYDVSVLTMGIDSWRDAGLPFGVRSARCSVLFSVGNGRPELVPVKGAGEFAVVADGAIAGAEGSEAEGAWLAIEVAGDVLAGGAMAGLAADIGEGFTAHGATVSAGFPEADRVAFHAVGIRLGAGLFERGEGVGVAGLFPDGVILRVALLAGGGADIGGGTGDAGNGVGIGLLGGVDIEGGLSDLAAVIADEFAKLGVLGDVLLKQRDLIPCIGEAGAGSFFKAAFKGADTARLIGGEKDDGIVFPDDFLVGAPTSPPRMRANSK